jgi:hypothetical protein
VQVEPLLEESLSGGRGGGGGGGESYLQRQGGGARRGSRLLGGGIMVRTRPRNVTGAFGKRGNDRRLSYQVWQEHLAVR